MNSTVEPLLPPNLPSNPKSSRTKGRRTFLIGSAGAVLSMFFTWLSGTKPERHAWTGETYQVEVAYNGIMSGGWLPLIYSMVIPLGFLVLKKGIPNWGKILSLLIYGWVIFGETWEALPKRRLTTDDWHLYAGGTGQWIFIFSCVACFVAVLRFPPSTKSKMIQNPGTPPQP